MSGRHLIRLSVISETDEAWARIDVAPSLRATAPTPMPRDFPLADRTLGAMSLAHTAQHQSIAAATTRLKASGCTEFVNLGFGLGHIPGANSIAEHVVSTGPYRCVVIDPGSFRDGVALALSCLEVAATGTAVITLGTAENSWLFGSDLAETLHTDPSTVSSDLEWAQLGSMQKTLAWTDHRVELAWEREGEVWQPRVRPKRLPAVSVILSTRRPEMVEQALEMIGRQKDVPVQLILGLHGGSAQDFDQTQSHFRNSGLDGSAQLVPLNIPFGAVLNNLAHIADGSLLAKWDDDDIYGPLHLKDLIAAHEHSRAPLVGKAAEFIYFQDEDVTVFRSPEGAESFSDVVAGGTLLIDASAFRLVGGFPPVSRFVDHYLKQRFMVQGLDIYRAHGFGFVLVRHSNHHTWEMDELHYRTSATAQWLGTPKVAGV